MGEKDVERRSDTEQLRVFPKRLLDDLRALEQVIDERKIGCLTVITDSKLVGLVTEREFTGIAGQLLEKMLQE